MSDYISSKQFLSLDKKVQDSIIKWWEPKIGDLYESRMCPSPIIDCVPNNVFSLKGESWIIPLLSESQLRNYIEYKIKDGINIYSSEDGYTLKVETDKGWFVACSEDLLECYLEIAVKVS
jgi:hypothetical protein